MSNAQTIPTQTAPVQIADAPDAAFRAPFFEINPDAGPTTKHHAAAAPRPLHLTETSVAALATSAGHAHAPAVCPPAPANSSVPSLEVHEPAAGQTVEMTVTPNQPLTFDFNPLDAKAVVHGDDLTLTFADGGVLVLHHIAQDGNPLPTSLQLPDGTIINPCELLQALPEEQVNPTAGSNDKIPNPAAGNDEKIPQPNPAAGPEQPNPAAGPGGAHPVVSPFDIPGFGPGLTPLGPLSPEGFNTGNEFPPPGNGGFPPTHTPPGTPPTTPPTPPTPPVTPHLAVIEDSRLLEYPGTSTGGNLNSDLHFGHPIVDSTPSAHVDSYVFWQPGSITVNPATDPAGVAAGMWGSLNMQTDGSYTYTLNATGTAAASQLGADILSQELGNPGSPDTPYPLLDLFTFTVDNGTETASQQLAMYTVADNINPSQTTAAVAGSTLGAEVLVTYTDISDPAHSFQQLMTIGSNGLLMADGAPIQPGDHALITFEYQGTATDITSFSIGGETFSGLNIPLDATDHALTAIINPDLSSFGDTGDTGSVIVPATGYTDVAGSVAATASGQYVYETAANPGATLSVASGSDADRDGAVLNLGSNTGHEVGGLGSDVLVYNGVAGVTYNGTAGVVINGTPTEAGTLTVFVDNSHLTGGSEAVTIAVTAGESSNAMANALMTAINGDAHLAGIGLSASAVGVGGDSFQFLQTGDSFTSPTTFEELAHSTSGNPTAESISGQTGIDTLRVDTNHNNLDLLSPAHDPATQLGQFANIDVIDLTAAAAGTGAANTVSLDADSVLQLTANENAAIPTYTGGNAMWVLGTANDTVNLNGFTQISSPITNSSQAPETATSSAGQPALTSASQMVGFAEYEGTSNGHTVHVYVANAIANAGHVVLH